MTYYKSIRTATLKYLETSNHIYLGNCAIELMDADEV
jgi:hypothetical protein